jgi:hypothetical protein
MAALLPAAAGCAVRSVAPIPEWSNPGCSRIEDNAVTDREKWKRIQNLRQLWLDRCGHPYPDPAVCRIDSEALRSSEYCVKKCVEVSGIYEDSAIFEHLTDEVHGMCRDGATLILLVHGFNHSYPEAHRAYKGTRQQVHNQYPDRKFAFLEVYWDGYYGDPFAIWPLAQCSSKWAGLGLRNLLRRLNPGIPVRVITHSRGAAVICSALWNTPMRGKPEEDRLYGEAQKALPPPVLPTIRIGLLAPAIRAADFECYFDRGKAQFCSHDRIVLGINSDDAALTAGGLSWLAGTSLGCSPAQFKSSVAPLLNRGGTRAFAVDFSGSAFHAFTDYVLRDSFEEQFLPLLLDDQGASAVSAFLP